MKFVYWTATVVAAVLAVLFALSNRELVTVSLWPLPGATMPAYLVVLLAALFGFLVGEFVAWVNGRRVRRLARERARRIAALERELAATQAMTTSAAAAVAKAVAPLPAPPRVEKAPT